MFFHANRWGIQASYCYLSVVVENGHLHEALQKPMFRAVTGKRK